jgi:hypothetical protein
MKQIEKWRWRTRWAGTGRMTPGKVHYTEAEIRARHPEAERVPGSMIIVEVPETDAERDAIHESFRRPPKDFHP